ncbi:hypothetical protein RIB2604_00101780 [Aspergillus luchuensis]|uniref:Uncharacterized protein n=1 Tax=Aspergillus kawachii TaxID=1069201 RepID=A0A146EXA8_ASPKA|nr:hypothetical protein RIB2604_00101780 [Aspergillus luchuensis]
MCLTVAHKCVSIHATERELDHSRARGSSGQADSPMVDRSRPAASASVEDIGTMRSLTGGGWPVVLVPPTSGEEDWRARCVRGESMVVTRTTGGIYGTTK